MITLTRPKLTTILIGIALFIFFVLVMFPYRNAKGWAFGEIYKMSKIMILAEDLSPVFLGWPGLSAQKVDVNIPLADGELALGAEQVVMRARLWGFTPAVSFNMKRLAQGGDLFIKMGKSGDTAYITSSAYSMNLQQVSLPGMSQTLAGKLSADIDLAAGLKDYSKTNGSVNATVDNFKIPMLPVRMSADYSFPIPAMNVGPVKANLKIKNGTIEVQSIQLGTAESDLSGTITGEMKMGRLAPITSMNLVIRLQFSNAIKTNPQSETMLSFLNSFKNEKTGNYAFRCNQNINSMTDYAQCLFSPQKIE